MEAKAFAPALRAIELQGRLLGLWQGDVKPPEQTLAELIAAVKRLPDPGDAAEGA